MCVAAMKGRWETKQVRHSNSRRPLSGCMHFYIDRPTLLLLLLLCFVFPSHDRASAMLLQLTVGNKNKGVLQCFYINTKFSGNRPTDSKVLIWNKSEKRGYFISV
jgi:hypothetical protein